MGTDEILFGYQMGLQMLSDNKLYGKFSGRISIAYRNDAFDIIPIMQELCDDQSNSEQCVVNSI